ncbi:MAG TPA: BON domain-containing protein [Candidatus Dormibacteraeota bacterium]
MTPIESRAVGNHNETRLPDLDQLEDAEIASAIADVLSKQDLPEDAVWVRVVAGHVRLEGEVERWSQRDTLERGVCHLKGVRGLTNLLTVRPEVKDREVGEKIVQACASPW